MLIELIENKEPEWLCECNGHNFYEDIKDINLCVSIDNKQVSMYDQMDSVFALQFSFTYDWYQDRSTDKKHASFCLGCKQYPYRIIKNPLK
jgi:hypothetical protein